jgi:hypothetical protein
MNSMRTIALLLTAAGCAIAAAAGAQDQPATADPKACAPGERSQNGESVAPRESLSEKLARTDGVICPPARIDPEIAVPPPPNSAKTPVIPPPGSPGGDPAIRPK